jgi:membrane protein YqaA with SNARE-associated domain
MIPLVALFVTVLALNLLPAFAPPTWMLMSYFGLRSPDASPWIVALVAATAATCGRCMLAHFAHRVIDSRIIPTPVRVNLSRVAKAIERRRATASTVFLFVAFSPLPSNALFLAYGMTRAPLLLLAVPFFAGRFASYVVAFSGGAMISRNLDVELSGAASLLYFVVSQIATVSAVYLFARINWRQSGIDRRLRWLRWDARQ